MKFRLLPDGYTWDYESAMESPTAPDGTPPTYSDMASASATGREATERCYVGRHPPAPRAYPTGGNRGGADR